MSLTSLTPYENLVIDKEYIICKSCDKSTFWKGTFRGEYQRYFENAPNLTFVNCVRHEESGVLVREGMNIGHWKNRLDFRKMDIFYDLEKVKDNSKMAIQNMEKRSLDMILKRLMNEHFEW
jgi:hypothetical protein